MKTRNGSDRLMGQPGMNIAICDDDNLEILHLTGILQQLDKDLSIEGFETG